MRAVGKRSGRSFAALPSIRLGGTVCAALGECPVVRYSGTSTKCATLARLAQDRIDVLKEFEPAMQQADKKKKSQLLILDRNVDLQSPFVHELTYQAAAYDLCPISDDVYEYEFEDGQGKTKTKQVQLGLNDELWDEFRHAHISTVFKSTSLALISFGGLSSARCALLLEARARASVARVRFDLPRTLCPDYRFDLSLQASRKSSKSFRTPTPTRPAVPVGPSEPRSSRH